MVREPRRIKFRKGLHPIYLPVYDALCKELSENWQPVSGLRSFEEQGQLFAKGRTAPGPIVTRAKPGMSYHNYGLATDWLYFRDERTFVDLKQDSPRWLEYIEVCNKVGARTLSFERPHNELIIQHSIDKLFMAYESGGMKAVDKLLLSKPEVQLKKGK